jgi:hypothetical protein
MGFPPVLYYFIPLQSNYFHYYSVFKHHQSYVIPSMSETTVPHPNRTTGKIRVLYILTSKILDNRYKK